jgi:hypothetical protein
MIWLLEFFIAGILFWPNTFVLTAESNSIQQNVPELFMVTVATEETDGLRRLRKSAEQFGHNLHICGLGQKWTGGDMNFKVRI